MSNELVEEVTPEVARNLSANEKKLKIEELRQQETTIKNGIADPKNIIHAMVFESQNILFSRWANNIKQLHYLGEYTEPINTICRYIKKQIGKMDALSLEKKENIYRNVERSLTSDFKENQDERQIVAENTSDLVEVEKSILVQMLKVFREYHRRFEELADTLLSHFENHENGLQILKDFENVLEWTEIATFCAPLEAMITPIHKLAHFENKLDEALEDYQKFDTLKAIDDDLNLRESATTIQQAMEKILIADGMLGNGHTSLQYRQDKIKESGRGSKTGQKRTQRL
ncbi:MAG: hypothetical protein Q8Q69_03250 [Nitrosopumilaceae archaeon]|nr:hypothetical protein [Nitrosopumilaceae archaeon]